MTSKRISLEDLTAHQHALLFVRPADGEYEGWVDEVTDSHVGIWDCVDGFHRLPKDRIHEVFVAESSPAAAVPSAF